MRGEGSRVGGDAGLTESDKGSLIEVYGHQYGSRLAPAGQHGGLIPVAGVRDGFSQGVPYVGDPAGVLDFGRVHVGSVPHRARRVDVHECYDEATLSNRRTKGRKQHVTDVISRSLAELPKRPHALYRFYDRSDVLLYVGITVDLPSRVSNHRKEKPWWMDVHHITIQHFDTRGDALAAEYEAIRTEGPLYNIIHNDLIPVMAKPLTEDEECEDCPGGHAHGRSEVALEVIDAITSTFGDERLNEAKAAAAKEMRLPEDERRNFNYTEVEFAALELAERTAADVWRFEYVVEGILKMIPPGLREHVEHKARSDWFCATGEAKHKRIDLLPDILRHLGNIEWGKSDA